MNILIKGMDMPKDGDRIYLLIEGDKCFNALDPIQTLAEAIQIPTPHGRLIDADALELEKEVELADDWKTAHEIANCVKYAPTILESEE